MKKKQNHNKWYHDEEKLVKGVIGLCLLYILLYYIFVFLVC